MSTKRNVSINNFTTAVIKSTKIKQELVRFLHTTHFFPMKSTWLKAIKNGNFATFLSLTAKIVSKYLLLEIPTILGHKHMHK